MTETLKLPVLPLTDSVLLPGMVVPVRLDQPEIQAAVDGVASGKMPELLSGQLARDALVMCHKECESVVSRRPVAM